MQEDNPVNIKQRLVGAIVIISLGIILLPMLLNIQDVEQSPTNAQYIPDLPEQLKRTLSSPIKSIPLAEAKPIIESPKVFPVDDVNIELYANSKSVAKNNSAKKNTLKKSTTIKKTNKVLSSHKNSSKKTLKKTPINKNPYKTFYVLQLGSFATAKNAQKLSHRLIKKKFRAYIEMVKLANGEHFRVRIGPYILHKQILKIQRQVDKMLRLKSQIIKQKSH